MFTYQNIAGDWRSGDCGGVNVLRGAFVKSGFVKSFETYLKNNRFNYSGLSLPFWRKPCQTDFLLHLSPLPPALATSTYSTGRGSWERWGVRMATISCRFRKPTKITFGKFWGGPGGPECCLIYPVYFGYISSNPDFDEASATLRVSHCLACARLL